MNRDFANGVQANGVGEKKKPLEFRWVAVSPAGGANLSLDVLLVFVAEPLPNCVWLNRCQTVWQTIFKPFYHTVIGFSS